MFSQASFAKSLGICRALANSPKKARDCVAQQSVPTDKLLKPPRGGGKSKQISRWRSAKRCLRSLNNAEPTFQPAGRGGEAARLRRYQREWARDAACARTVARFSSNQFPARSSSGLFLRTQNFACRAVFLPLPAGVFDLVSVRITMAQNMAFDSARTTPKTTWSPAAIEPDHDFVRWFSDCRAGARRRAVSRKAPHSLTLAATKSQGAASRRAAALRKREWPRVAAHNFSISSCDRRWNFSRVKILRAAATSLTSISTTSWLFAT